MTLNLRDHFDRAVRDDPGAPLGEMAAEAIAEGGRLRRRRRHRTVAVAGAAASVLVVLGVGAGLHRTSGAREPEVTIAAAMAPVTAPACVPHPADAEVTDVVVFLGTTATDAQRSLVETALRSSPLVSDRVFSTRREAFEQFRARWADNPDLLAAGQEKEFPDSFRVRLKAPGGYATFREQVAGLPGVDQISARRCTADAPIGGVL
jgi:cell division transport system permease protein